MATTFWYELLPCPHVSPHRTYDIPDLTSLSLSHPSATQRADGRQGPTVMAQASIYHPHANFADGGGSGHCGLLHHEDPRRRRMCGGSGPACGMRCYVLDVLILIL